MMKSYIHGAGCISPQHTAAEGPLLADVKQYDTNRLRASEPDYKQWIDLKLIRRMSRVVKMGVGAAKLSLQDAGIEMPDAIITGTAYGCLEDTGVFLTKMVRQQEEMLTPTAFIQSTHNTVAGQIALLLSCNAYNNTFVHRGFSFENALLDSQMLLQEGAATQVLLGGVDEITDHSHTILSRFGLYKGEPVHNTELLHSRSRGTIAGEGAAFFVLGAEKNGATAAVAGVHTIYKPAAAADVAAALQRWLEDRQLAPEDIDLLITGRNGDIRDEAWYRHIEERVFPQQPQACFKHLCGEYPTAVSFAMWMGARILQAQQTPAAALFSGEAPQQIKHILIYNHHQGTHHSLILLTAC
jgi:3-oxoacyl-[acyl-carrier-protein] synthase II